MIISATSSKRAQQFSGRSAVIGAVREKLIHRPANLIQKAGERRRITDIIQGEIRANDVARDEVQSQVQLAPTLAFCSRFMLFGEPFLTRRAHAHHAAERAPSPNILRPVLSTTRWIGARLFGLRFSDKVRPFPRREGAEKSGTAISTPSKAAMRRMKPWVCRSGCLKIMPKVRQSSICQI